jgi:hypothetical protein
MSVLTGSVVWSMTVSAPEGYLLCDGAEVNPDTHPGLHTHLSNAGIVVALERRDQSM